MERNRLVVSLLDESQEFQRYQAIDAERVGRELGFEVEVLFAANSAHLQDLQLSRILSSDGGARPAAILVQPVGGEGLAARAQEFARKGVGWILLNRRASYMEALRHEYPQLPIATVSPDQQEIGQLQARQLMMQLKNPAAHALYVEGPADTSAAQDRLEGTRAALAASASTIVLEVVRGDWTEATGERVVARWLAARRSLFRRLLRRPTWLPDALVCQNDHMAVGARRAARAAGLDVPVFGVDGLPESGRRLVDAGELAATVIVMPNTGTAIHLLTRKLRDGKPLNAEVLLSPLSYPRLPPLVGKARYRPGMPQ